MGEDLIQCYKNVGNIMELEKDTVTADAVKEYVAFQEGKGNQIAGIIEKLKSQQEEIMVWGTGSYAMSLFAETDLPQCNIQGFVDNNKLRQGRKIYGYSIYAPEILYDKNYTVLICSMLNGEEIRLQFEKMKTGNHCIVL